MAEKKAIALVLNKEEEAKRSLAQCYGVLVLGLGLEEAHHMNCGRCDHHRQPKNVGDSVYLYIILL